MPFLFNDLISPDITLYYHKSKTHSSIISKTLTILTLLVISAISTVILKDFFSKSRPNAFYYYNQFINDTGVYILNDSEIFHSITFMSDVKYDPKAISIIGVKNVHALTYLSQPDQTKHDHWIYESCNISTFPSDILNDISDTIDTFKRGVCLSKYFDKSTGKVISINDTTFKYPSIEHGSSNPNSVYYGIMIQMCKNSSYNNNSCYPQDIIEKYVTSLDGYLIYFVDNTVNFHDYNNPFKKYLSDISSRLSDSSFTSNNINLYPMNVRTNKGLLFDNIKETISYKFAQNEKITYNTDDSGMLGSIVFWMPNRVEIYSRSYLKLQDLAASIGGIAKFVLCIAKILNFLYNDYTEIKDFNNEMFSLKRKENDKTAKKSMVTTSPTNISTNYLMKITKRVSMNNYLKKQSTLQTYCKNLSPYLLNDFSFSNFFSFFLCNKKNQFLKSITLLRMKLLSEEMLYKNYKSVKGIKDYIKRNNCYVSNSNNNLITRRCSNICKTAVRQE